MTVKKSNGVRFNGLHSFSDFGMMLSKRPDKGVPKPDLVTVDVPGANGSLDFTESVTGNVVYGNRQMVFDFVKEIDIKDQAAFETQIMSFLHGQYVEVELDEDAGNIYSGRASVSFDNVEPKKMHVIVNVDAYPYKVETRDSIITVLAGGTIIHNHDAATVEFEAQKQTYGIARNSYFYLRSGGKPYADLSLFTNIWVDWDEETSPRVGVFYIKDSDGAYYSQRLEGSSIVTSPGHASILVGNFSGTVNITKIAKITINNIAGCRVYAYTPSAKTYIIENGDMPTVPLIIRNSAQYALELYCNNTYMNIPANTTQKLSEDFLFVAGKNEVVVKPRWIDPEIAPDTDTCTFRFKRGAL